MTLGTIIDKVQKICLQPQKFFMKKEKGLADAFQFLAILAIIPAAFGILMASLMARFGPAMSTNALIMAAVVGYIGTLILSFVGGGIYHLWVKYVFQGKATFDRTYQLCVYARTPSFLLGWIPLIGALAGIYSIVLYVIGTQKVHRISLLRSILAVVLPIAIIFVLIMVFMMLVMGTALGAFFMMQ